jgi:hypothetical protein
LNPAHDIQHYVKFVYVTNDHGYVPFVVNTSRSFPHSWLITGFVPRVTLQVSQVEQELPTLPEHLSSPPVFSEVHVARSLVFCVCFVDRCLSLFPFSLAIVLCVLLWFTDSDYLPLASSNSPCQWLRQVGGFLWVLKFPPLIKLTATI